MMAKKILTFAILVLLLGSFGCAGSNTGTDASGSKLQKPMLIGVSVSPKSFSEEDFRAFFEKVGRAGNVVTWTGDWNEISKSGQGADVTAALSETYKYTPVIIAQFFSQDTGSVLRSLDQKTKQEYITKAEQFAQKYKPQYLGFGVEINLLYESAPEDFEDFALFFDTVYDAVKKKSPQTKVFTVFQLERMKGLHGGLFGGENSADKSQWDLINKFPKADLIGFTSYPYLIYHDPSEIPSDYYTEIKKHVKKPIGFTEIGWHSFTALEGWESSEEEQEEFIKRFFELTKGTDPAMVVWPFMYDPLLPEPFTSIGLITRDEKEKRAWKEWMRHLESEKR